MLGYIGGMSKHAYDKYDDSMFSEEIDEDLIRELIKDGYSREEAMRMVGDYDPDEFDAGKLAEGTDRDFLLDEDDAFNSREFVDEEDFL